MNDSISAFESIVKDFTQAVERNDGQGLAALFCEDGCYSDDFYGDFVGRESIATMLKDHFWGHAKDFKWEMSNLVSDGKNAYAEYLFSYTSTQPTALGERIVFEGIAHFELLDGLIQHYSEVFNTGIALAQLNFDATRIQKHLLKKADSVRFRAGLD